ncbi:uncharacterized protein DNG_05753 [Cephalotrichum gorgonifer]|uniref:Protein kinase domain-containing protein n=1 Tax=Cephalotrichum gorgonifer TaxID=2041049 RepID=A0AAE8N1G4_9PEZI|nr:uncharacterized protein DNG_05753 [Cephalotrichum gorgonifer]
MDLSSQNNAWLSHSTIDHKDFVPLDTLTRMINEPNIKATLDATGGYSVRFPWFRTPSDLPKRIATQAKKIFAALILMDKVAAIHGLLEEGLEDKHLPLSRHREHEGLLSAHDGRIFPFVGWKPMSVTDFLGHKQWLFLAPVLNTADQFIKLDKEAPLPFIDSEVKGHGAAGIVHWAKIDKHHQLGFETETVDLVVAVKEFHRKDDFNQENTILQKIKDLQHPHIIRHLISIDKGDRAYIIFPWADGGNLQSFWEGSEQETSRESALWSMRQMKGLAEALHLLHERFQCRHGDLKPDNILCIREGGETVLKIADFGVSKIHHAQTINRKVATTSAFLTPSYQGPEVEFERVDRKDQRPRSRKYDIWSLGCVFLEFAIWLLHGPKTVESFASARQGRTSPNGGTSTPLYEVTDKAGKVAKVHQLVSWTIGILQENPRCKGETAPAALLELIKDQMLRTEVDQRPLASEVCKKLEEIVRCAEENESYLFHPCDGVSIPSLDFDKFQLRRSSTDTG